MYPIFERKIFDKFQNFIFSQGQALAKEWGCPFFEASAKAKLNVDELFAQAVSEMNFMGRNSNKNKSGCCTIL